METGSWAGLLPVWILGAPLLGAIIEWMRTPKVRTHRREDETMAGGSGGMHRGTAHLGAGPTGQGGTAAFGRDPVPAGAVRR